MHRIQNPAYEKQGDQAGAQNDQNDQEGDKQLFDSIVGLPVTYGAY